MADEEQPIRIDCDVTWEDLREFYNFTNLGSGLRYTWLANYSWRIYFLGFLMCLGATLLLFALERTLISLLLSAGSFGLIYAWFVFDGVFRRDRTWEKNWQRFKQDPQFVNSIGPTSYELSPRGVLESRRETTAWRPWSGIERIELPQGAVYLYTGPVTAFVIPAAAFSSAEGAGRLADTLRGWKRDSADAHWTIAEGETVTPRFDVTEADIYASALLSAKPLAPARSELGWAAFSGFIAFGMWPWSHSATALVVGPWCALTVFYSLVGSRLLDRFLRRRHARKQLATPDRLAGFTGMTLGIAADGLSEASPRSRHKESWAAIARIVPQESATFFLNRTGLVYILPARAFPTEDAYFDFVEKAIEYRRQALDSAA